MATSELVNYVPHKAVAGPVFLLFNQTVVYNISYMNTTQQLVILNAHRVYEIVLCYRIMQSSLKYVLNSDLMIVMRLIAVYQI